MKIHFVDVITNFMVLFAVIDITGSIPIIIEIKQKAGDIPSLKVTLVAFLLMLVFLFIGEPFLGLFHVDLQSFAIAGSLILFFLALEMVMGIELYKYDMTKASASIVPLSFPLIAGAGSLTTLISLKSEYDIFEILIGLTMNMVLVYLVLRATSFFERILGSSGILILKKVFGIILLAMAIRLFLSNTGLQLSSGGA
jgi:multiple antibiotic resistance protein